MRSTKEDESAVEKPRKQEVPAKPQRAKKLPPTPAPEPLSSEDIWERRWRSQVL